MRNHHRRAFRRGLLPVALALLPLSLGACDAIGSGSAGGESASLDGGTIEFVVPYEPGGGYDVYARLLAPYLEDCSGATVAVKNEPGAGGLLATARTFVSPADELRIQITNTVGIAGAQMAEAEGVQFEVEDFAWLGRVSAEPNVLVVASDSDITSFEDVLSAQEPISLAATGPGSNEYINSTVLPEVYDFPSEIVTGFDGGDAARAAVVSGDVDGHIQPLDSQISMIDSGDLRPLLLISRESSELLPNTPTLDDFEPETKEQREILNSLLVLTETGRGVVASPNVDDGLRAELEDAVDCALADEEFVAEVEAQERSLAPMSGQRMADLIDRVLGLPEPFRQLVREAS